MIRVSRGTLFAVAVAFAGSAFAQAPAPAGDGQWAKSHPRREEVNARLANQNRRINKEVREARSAGGRRPSCTSRITGSGWKSAQWPAPRRPLTRPSSEP